MVPFPVRVMLFLSSYSPLWLAFAVLLCTNMLAAAVGFVVLSVASVWGLFGYLRWCRKHKQAFTSKLDAIEQKDGDVMSYVASYLVPFFAISFTSWQQILVLVIFLLVLLVVYVNSNMIAINPMLYIGKFHVYEIELENSPRSHIYIARKRLYRGDPIRYVRLNDDIFLEK